VNGWSLNTDTDNFKMRYDMIQFLNMDMVAIAESHFRKNSGLANYFPGYRWMGNNRKTIHVKARSGSGGVGLLVKNELYDDFKISILDDSEEDILWVKLTARKSDFVIIVCVCYLVPEGSCRYINAADYFDTVLGQIYRYQNECQVMLLCGDFNSRIGMMLDHIEDIDNVPERNVVDTKTNNYGEMFCEFMLSASVCVLNGRNFVHNDFTSKDAAVVDYFLTPYEQLNKFDKVNVIRTRDLFELAGCVGKYDPSHGIPDHNVIQCELDLSSSVTLSSNVDETMGEDLTASFKRYKLDEIPQDFMCDIETMNALQETITRLELSEVDHGDINQAYTDFCESITAEMDAKLNPRVFQVRQENKRRRHMKKPFWTPELDDLYNVFREADRTWARYRGSVARKRQLKADRNLKQKILDREVQRAKRNDWRTSQETILNLEAENKKEFWKYVGNIGMGQERKQDIPWEVVDAEGDTCSDRKEVLNRWKADFSGLLNAENTNVTEGATQSSETERGTNQTVVDAGITLPIRLKEVELALRKAQNGKAQGFDCIPTEVLRNQTTVNFLHRLFAVCFEKGITPEIWAQGIINPIPKDLKKDQRIPLNYRGITLASCVYKLYCCILNERLTSWTEVNEQINDSQNGFRRGRSCQDHIATLTSIIDTRKMSRKSTYTAFVDFSKAYDRINRHKLFNRMKYIGLPQKFLLVLQSLYQNVKCSVRVNGCLSDWFPVSIGLKQGCILSPILFNLYLNSLVEEIRDSGIGVDLEGEIIGMLLYADDIVFLAETEADLQRLLSILHKWSETWNMSVNVDKTKVVHFKCGPATPRSAGPFLYGETELEVVERYRYLGVVLTEHLDLSITAKCIAQSAQRALGLLIAKGRAHGGFPFDVYTKLYNSLVVPILDYGSAVLGHRIYNSIKAVQHRASRYFLGVGKKTPLVALQGDMGWHVPEHYQWIGVTRQWCRMATMEETRINKRVFTWAQKASSRYKNYQYHVTGFYNRIGMSHITDIMNCPEFKEIREEMNSSLSNHYEEIWSTKLNREGAVRGQGRNKLRTYRTFKRQFATEAYVKAPLPRAKRRAIAKFRSGTAPLRLEIGRYYNEPEEERLCKFCDMGEVENEEHCITRCSCFNDFREELYMSATVLNVGFMNKSDGEKLGYILSHKDMIFITAKTCLNILKRRALLNRV
jgi:hypothetical protein